MLAAPSVILIGWAMHPPEPETSRTLPSRAEQECRRANRIQRSIDARFALEAAAAKARARVSALAMPTVVSRHSVETVRPAIGIYIVSYSIARNVDDYGGDNFIASVHGRNGGQENLLNEIAADLKRSVLLTVGPHVGDSSFSASRLREAGRSSSLLSRRTGRSAAERAELFGELAPRTAIVCDRYSAYKRLAWELAARGGLPVHGPTRPAAGAHGAKERVFWRQHNQ